MLPLRIRRTWGWAWCMSPATVAKSLQAGEPCSGPHVYQLSAASDTGVKARPGVAVYEDRMSATQASYGCQWDRGAALAGQPASTPPAYPLRL
jgi:hypothetical protein